MKRAGVSGSKISKQAPRPLPSKNMFLRAPIVNGQSDLDPKAGPALAAVAHTGDAVVPACFFLVQQERTTASSLYHSLYGWVGLV
jgi:hypothetical protein